MEEVAPSDFYIVGVAESQLGEVRDHTELGMLATAAQDALKEAGLGLKDVDGLFVNYMGEEGSVQVGEYLGICPRYSDSSDLGGAAFVAFVQHAMAAITAGLCEVALIAYASRQRTRRLRSLSARAGLTDVGSIREQFETPYGLPLPIGHYALLAARHMHQHGTTAAQLAHVAVAARRWAMLNPRAWCHDALTVDEVLASRMICDPLHRLDCCLITDGGGAIVISTSNRVKDARRRPVRILGTAEAQTHWNLTELPRAEMSCGAISARQAFERAGIVHSDVDFLQPYDSFTITVLLALEELGFCNPGESGDYVQGGALLPGGALPAMTSGGGLSYNHPGALGVLLLVEAVRQLRHEAGARQVPNAQIGVVHAVGGLLSTAATAVLARD